MSQGFLITAQMGCSISAKFRTMDPMTLKEKHPFRTKVLFALLSIFSVGNPPTHHHHHHQQQQQQQQQQPQPQPQPQPPTNTSSETFL